MKPILMIYGMQSFRLNTMAILPNSRAQAVYQNMARGYLS